MPSFFVTEVYHKPLSGGSLASLCREIVQEGKQIREYDKEGRKWCEKHYPGGYTSFQTFAELHEFSSTFRTLRERIDRAVKSYLRTLALDVEPGSLAMTDCWMNIMPAAVHHSMHIHPHSVLSGTFYAAMPRKARGIRFEDPRLGNFMARPLPLADAPAAKKSFVELNVKAGDLVLFESWLRHEVLPGNNVEERVSVSFNYA